ncbi:MAG: hypothetical protein RRZ64_06515 [Rikenellaceae bacterium]
MAKINVIGDALVVTSTMKMEDIKLLQKRQNEALVLKEENEQGELIPVFKVSYGEKPILGTYGATFSGVARDGSGNATLTLGLPHGISDVKQYIADEYGKALHCLNFLESCIATKITEYKKQEEKIMEQIVVEGEPIKEEEDAK